MLLNVEETARALNVDEKTVLRWIRKDGLQAERMDDEYRVNRVDLLEWSTERGFKVSPSLFKAGDEALEDLPTLSQALEAGGIHCNVTGRDMESVLRSVVSLLALPSDIDPEFVLQVLLAREALGTTAIGDGIAIPHVRNPILLQLPVPKVALCFLCEPVEFGALDNKPVQVLFTLTSPTVRVHLHLLSKLAYALREPRLRQMLHPPCNPGGILTAVREIEQDIGKGGS